MATLCLSAKEAIKHLKKENKNKNTNTNDHLDIPNPTLGDFIPQYNSSYAKSINLHPEKSTERKGKNNNIGTNLKTSLKTTINFKSLIQVHKDKDKGKKTFNFSNKENAKPCSLYNKPKYKNKKSIDNLTNENISEENTSKNNESSSNILRENLNKGNIPPITKQDVKPENSASSLKIDFVDFLGKSKSNNKYAIAILDTLKKFTFDTNEGTNKYNKSGNSLINNFLTLFLEFLSNTKNEGE